ncbi:glycerol-3-phosphate 1-O-acyltransferase PlsY [Agrilactobacillus fermenti]|uniref:glycerol-3-phosphate 1-O-acyltransferase PlsY n=1 Tax=Agrilactobacillus fermenti TaxID=2586909 RepID=UPI001E5A8538|nr:glycerol-3-phosphate 1-O-acyltransferase PlsY [Agrilactobacillus fermenti]MCD2256562.1 glycerol-3-phosphate 1-O-acyltransferase PlsY [Agrilactobacillus fermenti]
MKIALLFILSYLLGSIPSGVIIGKLFYQKDIRQYGSGNIGTTNTFRVLGKIPGTIVLILDILKGTLGTLLPIFGGYHAHYLLLISGILAVIGHCYSIYLRFSGGKAVATSAGVLLGYNPKFFLIAILIFLIIVLLSSMVSVASIVGSVFVVLTSLLFKDYLMTGFLALLAALLIYRHRANIIRIKNGNESIVPFGLVYLLRKRHSEP